MLKKSSQVALGGVIASLCTLLMLLTGLFPFLTYAAPAAAGFLLIAIIVDCGYRWAILVYLVVSVLSLFIVPDKQAAIIFVFLGYYPIIKDYLDFISTEKRNEILCKCQTTEERQRTEELIRPITCC
ncbi:MAG: hypothetical protein HFK04_05295, partial [Oscillospiraceae bacterium]|nr:hypothetical protein [Oscillospiraceae bacterium]